MPGRKVEPLADVLQRVIRSLDIEEKLLAYSVEPVWLRAVGERFSTHTRPAQLRNGVLTIECRSASWMTEVSLSREQLRAKVNTQLRAPRVHEIRLKLGGGFPPLAGASVPLITGPSPQDLARAETDLGVSAVAGDGSKLAAHALALSRTRSRPRR